MFGTIVMVALSIGALLLGIWMGMPGRYTQTPEDIEQVMAKGGGRRKRTKRIFTPLAWVQRQISARSGRQARPGRGFNLERPEDR